MSGSHRLATTDPRLASSKTHAALPNAAPRPRGNDARSVARRPALRPPRLDAAMVAIAGSAVAGVAIAAYLTVVHYAKAPLVCTSSGVVNCERVLSSSYSSIAGVPLSVGGIAWFTVSGALAIAALFRRSEPSWLQPLQVTWSLLGLGMVLYLAGVEVVALGVLCAWCTALHGLILVTLLLSLFRSPYVDGIPAQLDFNHVLAEK